MLRVCAVSHAESSSFLKVDSRKKQVSIMDPSVNSTSQQSSNHKRGASTQVPPKMFTFDSAFSHDASQAEVCAGTVAEVIQSVVNGADGCVFCFGHSKLGKTYTMIGKDDSMQNLGIIPCAISWLFKIITERKEKTGARFSVRVSAVEVWGKDENLKDLLSDVATGSLQDGHSPGVYLCEDPICGMQLQNQSELRAPTAEKAAFFLDAAIAARYSSRAECDEDEHRNSHMLFTLHIYQYRMEKSGKGGMSGGRSRLHLIDLGSCVKELSKPCESATATQCLSLSALGNVILALVNGSKHIPYKDSKLTMLLRESLGNMNCRTTMIAHISSSPSHFSETLSTLQIASRVLKMKKKKTKVSLQYTSSSSGGESSCEEGRMKRPTQLRNIHSRNIRGSEIQLLHITSDQDDYSSSEQSCDTVIYVGPNGSALSDRELTDNEGPPEFVPIITSIHEDKGGQSRQSSQLGDALIQPPQNVQSIQTLHPQTLPPVAEETAVPSKQEKDCLKCNTFAELQERLGCIDGSEEVNSFPFEEVLSNRLKKIESLPSCTTTEDPKRISNDQQLEEIREVVEEAEIAQSIIESLAKSTINTSPLSTSGTGGTGVRQLTSLQRANSLHNSRESISGGSSSDSKPRSSGSPRLGIASLTKTSEFKPPYSPSQRCKVYTQKGVMPNTHPQSTQNLYRDSGKSSTESLLQAEFRTSPVGTGPQVLKCSSSSNSLGSVDTLCDDVPQLPLDNKNSTPVTLQQLEPQAEDDLVFTLVEELTLNGIIEDGRPTSVISFNSECSVQDLALGPRPVSIISSLSEDLDCYSNPTSITTATISEANIVKFLPLSKEEGEFIINRRPSNSSWLTEMSTGSGEGQLCQSFVMQQCFGQGDGLAEVQLLEVNEVEELTEQNKEDGNVFCRSETSTKMSPTMGKTTVTISNVQTLCTLTSFSRNKTNITTQPCVALMPIIHDTPTKPPSDKDHRSPPVPLSSKMIFNDPWMKRESSSPEEPVCEAKLEKGTSEYIKSKRVLDRKGLSSCEAEGSDSFNRVIDGCEMVLNASENITPLFSANILRTGSLPRAWHHLNKQDDLDESSYRYMSGEYKTLGVTTSTPCSPRATLERRLSSGKQGFFSRPKGIPPLPPVRKSSLDQRNRASLQHNPTNNQCPSLHLPFLGSTPENLAGKQTAPNLESSRLFSAKLELLANRTNSLGRSHVGHYDCHSLERGESLMLVGSKAAVVRDSTMPRVGRSITRNSVSSPSNGLTSNSSVTHSPKSSQSKISAVTKLLMASPKSRSLSTSNTKSLSFSTKSLPQSVNRSSSLPPNGKNQNPNSWSTQSLSRSRGLGLASKLPLRAVNGRISELLQGSAGQTSHGRGTCNTEERGGTVHGAAVVHTLPSPYSKITAPRRPHRCSSGHASDNSSVLSGELPPAMGKTTLFYHSGGSSGYESMIRDSEATGSASSAQESMSDNSSSISGRRSLKNAKKRNTGTQRRRLIPNLTLDPTSPVRKPILSPGARWFDGPLRPPQRGVAEPFEIKVYEIDDVERLQRRRTTVSKGVVYFSAKLTILEHRQQRISEIQTKYDWLKKELEQTKKHLMLEPEKWTSEFDMEPVFEVDSLEYLEALEFVTQRLENRVNFCKSHLMMVTCFDVTCRQR
ncbi:kinesin-like protein KIF26B isoform X1 [Tachysurus fulvidraco]|uniref:kinesin-like protein KIF26B isoform X1 n=1 Tax=Tachysurus fulvidraco TaxID=1234273 RepID=UPI001FEE3E2A|nr:kinesin-like protein KIF26B isoform X1 [Tachysurus fulvidraco]